MYKRKRIFLALLFYSTSLLAQRNLLIDNCDDGNNQSLTGGWWYTYNDCESGGNSIVYPCPSCKFTMKEEGFGNVGYAAYMKGVTGNKLGWDYIGIGVTLSDKGPLQSLLI